MNIWERTIWDNKRKKYRKVPWSHEIERIKDPFIKKNTTAVLFLTYVCSKSIFILVTHMDRLVAFKNALFYTFYVYTRLGQFLPFNNLYLELKKVFMKKFITPLDSLIGLISSTYTCFKYIANLYIFIMITYHSKATLNATNKLLD